MKKSLVILSFAFIFLLSVSIVSAGWFSDLFSGKSTGDAVITGEMTQEDCDKTCEPDSGTLSGSDNQYCACPGVSIGETPINIRQGTGFTSIAGTNLQIAVRSIDIATRTTEVVVKEPNGVLETVTVASDGSAILRSGEKLTIGSVETTGGLFRRGATVEVSVTAPGDDVSRLGGEEGAESSKEHTHLSDYKYVTQKLEISTTKLLSGKVDCKRFGKDYVVLGGGFSVSGNVNDVLIDGPTTSNIYEVKLAGPTSGIMYATCARIETTLHQFSQDY